MNEIIINKDIEPITKALKLVNSFVSKSIIFNRSVFRFSRDILTLSKH